MGVGQNLLDSPARRMLCSQRGSGTRTVFFFQEEPAIPSSHEVARTCAEVAADKKAEEISVLDIGKLSFITDYFVICSGNSSKQLQAISLEVEARMKAAGRKRYGQEGYESGRWILLDYGDVVMHLFMKDLRKHYDLESNWADARRVDWKRETEAPVPQKTASV